jgi:hypothetical protein
MHSGSFNTLSSSIVIYSFAKQSLTMKQFNFWGHEGLRFCALRDAIMGLRRKKPFTQARPVIPFSLTNGYGIFLFLTVCEHTHSQYL